jgi:hypothetical protein
MTTDPIFKDTNKNGKLDGAEVIAALTSTDQRIKTAAKELMADLLELDDEDVNEANAFIGRFKKEHPSSNDLLKDLMETESKDGSSYADFFSKKRIELNSDLKNELDKVEFCEGISLVTDNDLLQIFTQLGVKIPTIRQL